MLRVLICDDAIAFTVLLEHWLRDCGGLEVVARTSTPEEAVHLAGLHAPDVIVLDHRLGATTSERLAPLLRDASPGSAVLLISGMADADLERAAAACGADAWLSKAASADAVCDAVRAAGAARARR